MKFVAATLILNLSALATADFLSLRQVAEEIVVRNAALEPRNPIASHLQRRQLAPECASVCSPLVVLGTCTSGPYCDCPIILSSGPACASCIRPTNATLANEIITLEIACQEASRTSSTPSPVVTGTPAPAACTSACGAILAAPACSDGGFTCNCAVIAREGPLCAQCALTVENNATAANIIIQAVNQCAPLAATGTSGSSSLAPSCVSACQQFAATPTGCSGTDPFCICKDVLAAGPICSACLAPRNASAASIIGDGISLCRSVVGLGTSTGISPRTSTAGGIIITNVPSASQTGGQAGSTGAAITINGVQSSPAKKNIRVGGNFGVAFVVATLSVVFLGWIAILDF